MRVHVVLRYVGFSFLLNAGFLFLASLVALLHADPSFLPLIYSSLVSLLFGLFPLLFVPPTHDISNTEGLAILVFSWLACCLVGTLPYVLWGAEFTLTNAWFESVSGYTTTGSSILRNVEALPAGLLFWRSLTHWIGGMGILVFVLAILPLFAGAETTLYRAEISSLTRENFRYRTRKAIQILLVVYAGLTVTETLLLSLCGMSFFDAVTNAFATVATGGFSTRNQSIAHYQSVPMEIVIVVFMVLSGIHFGLLFSAVRGRTREVLNSSVVRYYGTALILGTLAIAWNVYGTVYESGWEAVRYALFQVVSVGTSTGFATADTTIWPPLAQWILILFTLQCACAGSTSGGIKVDRIVVFGKALARTVRKTLHPAALIPLKMDRKPMAPDLVEASLLYVLSYLSVVVCSTILLTAQGVDLLSAFTGSAACMGNVGPGFGTVGSLGNFADLPVASKWVLSITMLLGRLEIYGFLALLMPGVLRGKP